MFQAGRGRAATQYSRTAACAGVMTARAAAAASTATAALRRAWLGNDVDLAVHVRPVDPADVLEGSRCRERDLERLGQRRPGRPHDGRREEAVPVVGAVVGVAARPERVPAEEKEWPGLVGAAGRLGIRVEGLERLVE